MRTLASGCFQLLGKTSNKFYQLKVRIGEDVFEQKGTIEIVMEGKLTRKIK